MTSMLDRFAQGGIRGAPGLLALGAALLLLLGIVAGSVWLSARNAEALRTATVTQDARTTIAQLTLAIQDAEAGQRGYLLTGKDAYLDPYRDSLKRLPGLVEELARSLPQGAEAQRLIVPLRAATDAKLAELSRTIALYAAGDEDGAIALVQTDQGEAFMAEIRRLSAGLAADQQAMFDGQFADIERRGWLLVWIDSGGVLVVLLLGALAAVAIRRTIRTLRAARSLLADANVSLEEANDSLEGIVARRTADLTAANEEIQRFAYIVSHDLRAPLVNIMGFTSELEQAAGLVREHIDAQPDGVPPDVALAANDDMPEALRFIRTSTAKMDRLIGAILKLSREGRRMLTPERLDMAAVLEEIAESLEHQVQAAGAAIEVGKVPDLVADRVAVEQVFANVAENALKYGQPGRPVRIRIGGRLEDGMAHFTVSDNGRGIHERDRERVFELFRRAGDQSVAGEGIGLAHVRALVRRLGGSIRFESVLEEGTVFHILLPPTPQKQTDEAA